MHRDVFEYIRHVRNEFANGEFEKLLTREIYLAHYTSLDVAAHILKEPTIWMSSPLLMNDMEEMREGLSLADTAYHSNSYLDATCKTLSNRNCVDHYYTRHRDQFDKEHLANVFVFCMTQHNIKDDDGLLSMWRGYGGNGRGCALVFNTSFADENFDHPLVIAKVSYLKREDRIKRLDNLIRTWCEVLRLCRNNDDIDMAVYNLFDLFLFLALTTKHCGFSEEKEWRIIYTPADDPENALVPYIGHSITQRGIEPKLRFPIRRLPEQRGDWSFDTILEKIILGPTLSRELAKNSFKMMLRECGKGHLIDRIVASGIPLRPFMICHAVT